MSVDTSNQSSALACTAAPISRPASEISPSTSRRSPPVTTVSARVIVGASSGIAMVARRPARAAYVDQAAPALPLVGMASRVAPELLGPGDADGGAARLEGAGRQQAVVLDQQSWQAELGAEARSREQRGHPLAEGDDVLGRGDGQQLVVAPQVRSAAGDGPRVGADASEVVPRQQR